MTMVTVESINICNNKTYDRNAENRFVKIQRNKKLRQHENGHYRLIYSLLMFLCKLGTSILKFTFIYQSTLATKIFISLLTLAGVMYRLIVNTRAILSD